MTFLDLQERLRQAISIGITSDEIVPINEFIASANWQKEEHAPIPIPQSKDELWEAVRHYLGIEIPRKKICPDHSAPFDAFAEAYFAEYPVSVWVASRGFGGKSVMLAALGAIEAITLGASVNLLGGSGEQAARVHEYMKGEEPNLSNKFWKYPTAPVHLLKSDPTKRETNLSNLGRIRVLMASARSLRGPHPQRARYDEIDEMAVDLYKTGLGQAMAARGIKDQTVLCSTHHKPKGTMTEVLKSAKSQGWPIHRWCYKESMQGWLTKEMVARKRQTVLGNMWATEYDLETPTGEGLAIMPDAVERMFNPSLGRFDGSLGQYIEIEPPAASCKSCGKRAILESFVTNDGLRCPRCKSDHIKKAQYSTGCDWAKERDFTDIWTFRHDVYPYKMVAFERLGRKAWPAMVKRFDKRVRRYPGSATYDHTGIGGVISDYMDSDAYGFVLQGARRMKLLQDFAMAIEGNEFVAPMIQSVYDEFKYATYNDLYGSGHLPDSICAGALSYFGISNAGWVR